MLKCMYEYVVCREEVAGAGQVEPSDSSSYARYSVLTHHRAHLRHTG